MTRCYGLSYHCNTWLTYDPLYEPATGSTHPRLTQHTVITGNINLLTTTDTSFLRWSSSCILRLVRPQLLTSIIQLHSTTRPTSAFDYDHPAVFYDSSDLSLWLRSSSCILPLVRPQPSTTIIQLYSTTRPTSAFDFDHPAAFYHSSDLSLRLRSSSCILRLVRPQPSTSIIQLHSTTRPTSAFNYDHPAAFYDSTYANYPRLTSSCAHLRLNYTSYHRYHSRWRPYSTTTDLSHVCRSDNKLSFVMYVTSPLFLHCLWLSLTHMH